MRDAISIGRVKLLHPKVRDEVLQTIDEIEAKWPLTVAIRIVQGLRTIEEQDALYAQGRTKPGKVVTKAKGGKSYHNFGLAIDFCLLYDKNKNLSYETLSWDEKDPHWMEVVSAFQAKGWEWGGDWVTIKDNPHLQKTMNYSWRELLKKYNKNDFIEGTKYVTL